MSKAMEASSVRRLVGLFTTSANRTTSTALTSTKPSSKATMKARKLQGLVNKFKQSSESDEFRYKSQRSYDRTVRRLASAKQFSLIDDILQHQKKYQDIAQEGFVIRLMALYGKAGMFEHAQKLFDEMPELKCDPLSVVDTLEKKGLEPDVITFNTLLDGLFSKGRIADGEKIWGLMEEKNVVPNVRTYNSKLRGLVYEKEIVKAVELWEEMENKGIKPDVYSYNAMIKGYCNAGNIEQVKKWYTELKKSGISPDRVTYVTLVSFLCKKSEFEMAVELCKESLDRRVTAGAAMFQTVIGGLVKESRVDEAIQLVELGKSRLHYKLKLH
ncbi:Pentatricopeptide repeat - like 10 [Theobroma cacao]|nr:Pentatricopeptide repeat - like 10 [Theobroma cacao]